MLASQKRSNKTLTLEQYNMKSDLVRKLTLKNNATFRRLHMDRWSWS